MLTAIQTAPPLNILTRNSRFPILHIIKKTDTLSLSVVVKGRWRMDKMLPYELMLGDMCKSTHIIYFSLRISSGLIIECNQGFAESLGYINIQSCMAAYTPSDCRVDNGTKAQLLYDLVRVNEVNDIMVCFYRYDRSICWINLSAIRYIETDIVACIGFDVTEKQLAIEAIVKSEKRIIESREKYQSLFDNAITGLFRTTISDGTLIACNHYGAKLLGYDTPEEAIKTFKFSDHYVDPGFRDYLINTLSRLGRIEDTETGITNRYGKLLWIKTAAKIFPDKGYLEGVAIDISQQKQAENALLQYSVAKLSNERLNIDEIINETLEKISSYLNAAGVIFTTIDDPSKKTFSCKQNNRAHSFFIETAIMEYSLKIKNTGQFITVHPNELRRRFPGKYHGIENLSYAGFPVQVSNHFYGILHIFTPSPFLFNENSINLIVSVCDHLGLSFENNRLRTQNLLTAVMNERHRVARGLHDSVNQSLYSLSLLSEAAFRECEKRDSKKTKEYLFEIRKISQDVLKEMRMLIDELRPLALNKNTFIRAVQNELKSIEIRENIVTRFEADDIGNLTEKNENELFRIFQEAISNILQHAFASEITVSFKEDDAAIHFEVRDNGKGFVNHEIKKGMGIINMQERAEKCKSVLSISSAKGIGTRIVVTFAKRHFFNP